MTGTRVFRHLSRLWGGLFAFCLCVLLLSASVLPSAALPLSSALNYGMPDRDNNRTLSGASLYETIRGYAPDADEIAALDEAGVVLTYNNDVPSSLISTDYNSEKGVLTVTSRPYSFTAGNGEAVAWIPEEILFNGQKQALSASGDAYTAQFGSLFFSEDFEISVIYRWKAAIPEKVVDEIASLPYLRGKNALETQNAYLASLAEYERAKLAYAAYTAYLSDVAAYEAYLREKADYDDRLAKYNAYLQALADYRTEKAAYDEWQAYYEYVDFLTNHLEEYNAYLLYERTMEKIRQKLAVLDSVFSGDSHGWVLYNSIMGGTVDTVVANQELLINGLQCSAEDVHLAGDSTEALRVLLKEYDTLRNAKYEDDYARTAALYAFYTGHYGELKQNFIGLYSALYALYDFDLVRQKMKAEGKIDHYQQFVGQLYVIATCLDDDGNRNAEWTISSRKLSDVVESAQRIADTDSADPSALPLPAKTAPVEKVEPAEKPTVPQPALQPTVPREVPAPGDAPAERKEPAAVPFASDPGDVPPAAPEIDELSARLAKSVADGRLKAPEAAISPLLLPFEKTVTRTVSIRNEKTVTFHDMDGTVLASMTVDYGSSVNYPIPIPDENPQYSYRVRGWVDWDGSDVNLSRVEKDLSLYPLYDRTLRSYTVTWTVDGSVRSSLYYYGTVPTPPQFAVPEEEAHHYYVFSGWDHEIVPVAGDTVYSGTMLRLPKSYTVTWIAQNGAFHAEETYLYGEFPVFKGETDIPPDRYLYTFTGWDRAVVAVSADVTYTALYNRIPLAQNESAEVLELLLTPEQLTVLAGRTGSAVLAENALRFAAETNRSFLLRFEDGMEMFFDREKAAALSAHGIKRLAIVTRIGDSGNAFLPYYYTDAGKAVLDSGIPVTLTLPEMEKNGGKVIYHIRTAEEPSVYSGVVTVQAGTEIPVTWVHAVSVEPNEFCNVAALVRAAQAGETVSLRLSCLYGYEISSATVFSSAGENIPVRNLSFIMPNADVKITLTVTKIVYRVRFLADGNVISEAEYGLGDEIVIPDPPAKPETDEYRFTFTDWDPVPMIASGPDRTLDFTAQFTRVKKDVAYPTGHNNNLLIEVILPCVGGGILLLIAGLIVFLKLRKKKKKARLTAEKPAEEAEAISVPECAPEAVAEAIAEAPAEDAAEEPENSEESEEPEAPEDTCEADEAPDSETAEPVETEPDAVEVPSDETESGAEKESD